jgi:transposase InsO family protein
MDVQSIHEEGLQAAKDTAVAMITAGKDNLYCGCAWAEVHPARGPLIQQMLKRGIARKGVYKGAEISVQIGIDTQSMDVREAAVRSYCEVLKSYGIPASVRSRAT